ncbi:hypothetical protein DC522_10790 [Microvirga sp. KLBC 81]|uniref:hypothetical protein n=1 Tax=Microvirga sp. KLBC 81 TaxID=1862707 RepID=UPI000D50F563|nr:hypothetical protein [Microvirga sp. KLBC 81]PVE24349.1 hypothetical protein DC522_10790 [Microvirga sp. KLBC 81]
MPDDKIDQKRPAEAENEPKPIQQRHVDDTVDDSFPASDPPAWTTSGTKSVAAECEPDALNEIPTPPGQGLEGKSPNTAQSKAEQATDLARDLYRRGQTYLEQGRRYLPEAERYYRQGADVVSRPVQEHPLATVLAVGALGCMLGWMLGRRMAGHAPARQWHPGSNQRSTEIETWRPTPNRVRRAGHFSARDEIDAASHTNNSF